MSDARAASARSWAVWGGLFLIAAGLSVERVVIAMPEGLAFDGMGYLQRVVLVHGILPRMAMALLAGAALGISGFVLQRVLRNPLAEPSTLGISAGAQLALAAATLYAPVLMETAREGVALAGGLGAVGLLLALTWRRRLEPVAVALAGMMLGLTATTASAALILANGDYMFSLFLWGGGSLVQQGWGPAITVGTRLAAGLAALILLARPLALFGLGDEGARSLGAALLVTRLLAIGVAVWLAATVTAEAGVIGFVGLAAPALARLSGARTQRARMIAAPLVGALLLWLTDGLVQILAGSGGERVPTGAATALLGGPLLLWLLPRLRLFEWPATAARPVSSRHPRRPAGLLILLILAVGLSLGLALCVGQGPDGWTVSFGDAFQEMLPWRGPRVVMAVASGAMLAAAGAMLQRITGNPLAGPEILGVGTGSGVGLAVVLFTVAAPGLAVQAGGAAAGAVAALAVLLVVSRHGGLGPERLLLAGIAIGAAGSAVLTAVIATGSREALMLLRWLSGTTNDAAPAEAGLAVIVAGFLLALVPLFARGLRILPLGAGAGRSLGLSVGRWRTVSVILAGLLAALGTLFVGPLSFIGLIAPHLARLLGLRRVLPHVWGSVLIGGALMVLSDWLSRTVAFPYQLPLGLFASLLGGAYLVWLLGREHPTSR